MAVSKVILNGTTLMDTTQKTVTAGSMLNGVTALKNDGTDITGNITSKTSSDLTASGATVTAPAGYYASSASKAVASGTAGTPTATKGTVTNHSVSVTPSVTNTSGYITGGTKSGTAVTVSASELVSGTLSITDNGTGIDVTNYAAVDVSVSGGGIQTKSVTSNYPFGNWCYVDANGVAQTFAPSGPGDVLDAVCPVGSLISVVSKNSSVPSVTNATLVWSKTSSRDTYKWIGTFQVDS